MSKRENFYRRDPSKALSGMIGLSLEERGVYNTILDLLYSTWRPIEDDRRFIANWCGCAVQKLNPILNRLIEKERLITFTEGGRTYVSDEAFEDERKAVKGTVSTRSGRAKVEEKSGEVEEKSASVGQNPPLLDTPSEEKQEVTALEKTREEKITPYSPPRGTKAKVSKDQVEAVWVACPAKARERSSRADVEGALNAALSRGHQPEAVLAGLLAAYRSDTYSGDTAKGIHRLIDKDRWHSFVETAPNAAPVQTFPGPPNLRASVVAAKDEAFALAWIDPCGWRDDRTLLARNTFALNKLRAELGEWMVRHNVRAEIASETTQPKDRAA